MEKLHREKNDYPIVLTVKDLQNILEIGQNKAYELTRSKGFPILKLNGSTKRIPRDKFFEWMEGDCSKK